MPYTVSRYAGRHPPVVEGGIPGASGTHTVGGRFIIGKNPVHRADGAGEAGNRWLHVLSGRAVRTARGRAQAHGGQAVVPYHHHGEPEVRKVALVERGQGMAGREELRHDTGDYPDDGRIDKGRFHE